LIRDSVLLCTLASTCQTNIRALVFKLLCPSWASSPLLSFSIVLGDHKRQQRHTVVQVSTLCFLYITDTHKSKETVGNLGNLRPTFVLVTPFILGVHRYHEPKLALEIARHRRWRRTSQSIFHVLFYAIDAHKPKETVSERGNPVSRADSLNSGMGIKQLVSGTSPIVE